MTKHFPLIVIPLLIIPLLLTSCTGGSSKGILTQAESISRKQINNFHATQTEEILTTLTPKPTIKTTAASENNKPVEIVAENQKITIIGYDLSDLDPINSYMSDLMVAYSAFVGLTRIDIETKEVGAGMASSWKTSNSGLTWTFTLMEGIPWVRFNPDTEKVEQVTDQQGIARYVVADDFVYGISRVLDPDLNSGNAFMLEMIAEVTNGSGFNVKAKDDHTLVINLTEKTSYFDAIAELPIMGAQPRWLIEEVGDAWIESGIFQGYGPYILKEWVPDQHITLIRNPYWEGTDSIPAPSIEEITFLLAPVASALAQFSINKTDVVVVSDDLSSIRENSSISKYLQNKTDECSIYIGFNTNSLPVNNPTVRRALSLTLDKQSIVKSVYYHEPAQWLAMPESRGASNFGEGETDNMEEALELLKGVYPEPSNMPELVFTAKESDPGTHMEIIQMITEMWTANLGVSTRVEILPNDEYFASLNSANPPAIFWRGYCLDYNDAANMYRYVFEDDSPFGWNNTNLSSLQSEVKNEENLSKREKLYREIEDNILVENTYIIPLYWQTTYMLVNPMLYRTYPLLLGLEQFEKWYVRKL
jgi:oligopeptide transport system substrate-binding protein